MVKDSASTLPFLTLLPFLLSYFILSPPKFPTMLFPIPPMTLKIMYLLKTHICLINSSFNSRTDLGQKWFHQKKLPPAPLALSQEGLCTYVTFWSLEMHHDW